MFRVGLGLIEIALTHLAMICRRPAFDAVKVVVELALTQQRVHTLGGGLGINIEHHDQVGPNLTQGDPGDALDILHCKAPGGALVGEGRVGEAIAHDEFPRLESRPHHLAQVLGPVGKIEPQLALGTQTVVLRAQDDPADLFPDGGRAGLTRENALVTFATKSLRQPRGLSRLPGSFDAFESNEYAQGCGRLAQLFGFGTGQGT